MQEEILKALRKAIIKQGGDVDSDMIVDGATTAVICLQEVARKIAKALKRG